MPALAAIERIGGIVSIDVRLDATGVVRSAAVVRSPSALLNDAALLSATKSHFSPEIFRCRPVAAHYDFVVEFVAR